MVKPVSSRSSATNEAPCRDAQNELIAEGESGSYEVTNKADWKEPVAKACGGVAVKKSGFQGRERGSGGEGGGRRERGSLTFF